MRKEPNPNQMTYVVGTVLVVLSILLTALNVWLRTRGSH